MLNTLLKFIFLTFMHYDFRLHKYFLIMLLNKSIKTLLLFKIISQFILN